MDQWNKIDSQGTYVYMKTHAFMDIAFIDTNEERKIYSVNIAGTKKKIFLFEKKFF